MTNQNNYTPAPLGTTSVQLPEELMALAEAISKNVHEVWAQNRMNEEEQNSHFMQYFIPYCKNSAFFVQ